jgi:diguanylate cyclase (GGDEF)-like protein
MEHLNHNVARCRRDGSHMAVVMADIDHFKTINDSLGHQVGDEVLVLVSQCLRDHLRSTDTVCRWGGDELMILLPDLEDRRYASVVCEKLVHALNQRLSRSSLSLPVTLSMGYAVFPEDASEPEILMQQADHALYEAKAAGRNCWREFMGYGTRYEAKGKPSLYLRLNRAIENQLIDAHFQPIVDAATGRVASLEALARWQDKYDGWISPEVFITLAEEKGLIQAIGQQIATKTFRQLKQLRDAQHPVTVSLNLSRAQLIDPNFQPWVTATAARYKLQHGWIVLEMTERESLLTNSLIRKHLEELAQAGFRLSLDDFGTGFASLDVVAEMPFHELKIPQAISRKLEMEKGFCIVKAIVDMAKALGLTVVAEGVETEQMARQLRETGVDKLQGYLFSKPLSPKEISEFVEKAGAIGCAETSQGSFSKAA